MSHHNEEELYCRLSHLFNPNMILLADILVGLGEVEISDKKDVDVLLPRLLSVYIQQMTISWTQLLCEVGITSEGE